MRRERHVDESEANGVADRVRQALRVRRSLAVDREPEDRFNIGRCAPRPGPWRGIPQIQDEDTIALRNGYAGRIDDESAAELGVDRRAREWIRRRGVASGLAPIVVRAGHAGGK